MTTIPISFPVPPLHEPGSPPPPLPILATHTSITAIPLSLSGINKLAAHNTLPILRCRVDPAVLPSIRSATPNPPPTTPTWRSATPNLAVHSGTTKSPTVRFRAHTPSDNNDISDISSLTSLPSNSDMDADESDDGRIPKPRGEAGRPQRGGYTLKAALNWKAKDYKTLKVRSFKQVALNGLLC